MKQKLFILLSLAAALNGFSQIGQWEDPMKGIEVERILALPPEYKTFFRDTNEAAHAEFYTNYWTMDFQRLLRTNTPAERGVFWRNWASNGVPVAMVWYATGYETNELEGIMYLQQAYEAGAVGALVPLIPRLVKHSSGTAINLCEAEAVRTRRLQPDILNVLALAYDANGQFDKGFQAAAEAVALAPDDPVFRRNLQILWRRLHP